MHVRIIPDLRADTSKTRAEHSRVRVCTVYKEQKLPVGHILTQTTLLVKPRLPTKTLSASKHLLFPFPSSIVLQTSCAKHTSSLNSHQNAQKAKVRRRDTMCPHLSCTQQYDGAALNDDMLPAEEVQQPPAKRGRQIAAHGYMNFIIESSILHIVYGPPDRSRLCLAARVTPPGVLTSTSTSLWQKTKQPSSPPSRRLVRSLSVSRGRQARMGQQNLLRTVTTEAMALAWYCTWIPSSRSCFFSRPPFATLQLTFEDIFNTISGLAVPLAPILVSSRQTG